MLRIFDIAVLALYPLLVYGGLRLVGVRWTALILFVLLGRRFLSLLLRNRETSRLILIQAAAIAAIVGLSAASGSEFALRLTPFAVSLTFIVLFASSLKKQPIIERFARLKRPDLPPDHVAYCLALTKIWIGVLACNSIILLAASFLEDEAVWAILVGPVSYGLLGTVFSVEYLVRKWRFQDFDEQSLLDRLIMPLLRKKVTR